MGMARARGSDVNMDNTLAAALETGPDALPEVTDNAAPKAVATAPAVAPTGAAAVSAAAATTASAGATVSPFSTVMSDPLDNVFDGLVEGRHIFRDREVLSSTYLPPRFPHRDTEIRQVAQILWPALEGARPSNILAYGQTGTGKTAVVKHICRQLEQKAISDGVRVRTAYINCKQVNTPYGILANIGQTYITNWEETIPHTGWRLEKVYSKLRQKVEEAAGVAVVVLDEIDWLVSKSGDEVLYHLTGLNADLGAARMSLIGISNDTKFTTFLDPRVKSRLGEESLTFPPYNANQLRDILRQRAETAFHEGAVEKVVLAYCASRAAQEHGDARKALDLLRIAAEMAEREGQTRVSRKYVDRAESQMEQDQTRKVILQLPIQHKAVLMAIVVNEEHTHIEKQTTGDVYDTYRCICRRFETNLLTQRRIGDIISELDMQGLINARVVSLGRHGRTRYINVEVPYEDLHLLMAEDSFMAGVLEATERGYIGGSAQARLI